MFEHHRSSLPNSVVEPELNSRKIFTDEVWETDRERANRMDRLFLLKRMIQVIRESLGGPKTELETPEEFYREWFETSVDQDRLSQMFAQLIACPVPFEQRTNSNYYKYLERYLFFLGNMLSEPSTDPIFYFTILESGVHELYTKEVVQLIKSIYELREQVREKVIGQTFMGLRNKKEASSITLPEQSIVLELTQTTDRVRKQLEEINEGISLPDEKSTLVELATWSQMEQRFRNKEKIRRALEDTGDDLPPHYFPEEVSHVLFFGQGALSDVTGENDQPQRATPVSSVLIELFKDLHRFEQKLQSGDIIQNKQGDSTVEIHKKIVSMEKLFDALALLDAAIAELYAIVEKVMLPNTEIPFDSVDNAPYLGDSEDIDDDKES